jgi:hypothetical protein
MKKVKLKTETLYGGDNHPMDHYYFVSEDGITHGEVVTISNGDVAEQWLEIEGKHVAYSDDLLVPEKRAALKLKYPDAGFVEVVDEMLEEGYSPSWI